jgi:hypothetical protein
MLPLDVYGVIAEFLAGAHAFKSLSHLNIANHTVHDETLPVLYETFFMDLPRDVARMEQISSASDVPQHYRYVK